MVFNVFFEVQTPVIARVRTTVSYWKQIITRKHPAMANMANAVRDTLQTPDQVRLSRSDAKVFLYYKNFKSYHICVVVKSLNGQGFIVTTYKTENIKEGKVIWPK